MSKKNDIKQWLALNRAPGVGARRFLELLEQCDGIGGVFESRREQLARAGLSDEAIRFLRAPDAALLEADLEWLQEPAHSIITFVDRAYPKRLRQLKDAPPLLFVKGDATLLDDPQIAVVGARSPTPAGRDLARCFARDLARSGLLVTSGLARGIDAAAHQGALDAGQPTVAVIATGPDLIYPAENKSLAHEIAERGALVSEFPCATPPLAPHFPRRNRIISGLALGTLVIEAGERSGSLITARLAGEQGREVFAVPGSPRNPSARGCHRLIRQGAILVEDARDVLAELQPQIRDSLKRAQATDATDTQAHAAPTDAEKSVLDDEHRALLEHVGFEQTTVDALVERSGLPVQQVSAMLLMLELEGYVASAGGFYQRIK